ncbi:MAG: dihydropteroate synthase [Gammaproteobacteria bacterium]|nr:dihydropteroate synthase [Gammaproteobacteria bacterium]
MTDLDLRSTKRPWVMGILNITPDSFADGGKFLSVENALTQARQMIADGADIIDIGGESTRPGAEAVNSDEELDRVIPIIEAIRNESTIPISIDTSKPSVMQAAAEAGVNLINDVNALRADGAVELAAKLKLPVCLMHMKGEPRTMQTKPHYENVVQEVLDFLLQRVDVCTSAGIDGSRIWLDPGFGFGKSLAHNLQLLKHLHRFVATDFPVLVGVSRKSMFKMLLDLEVQDRLPASLSAEVFALTQGAHVLRVHDVRATVEAVKVFQAIQEA